MTAHWIASHGRKYGQPLTLAEQIILAIMSSELVKWVIGETKRPTRIYGLRSMKHITHTLQAYIRVQQRILKKIKNY